MANPLFNQLSGNSMQGNGPMAFLQRFQQFRQSFQGDANAAKAEVERMVSSGQINQQQLNQLQNIAMQIQRMTGIK